MMIKQLINFLIYILQKVTSLEFLKERLIIFRMWKVMSFGAKKQNNLIKLNIMIDII